MTTNDWLTREKTTFCWVEYTRKQKRQLRFSSAFWLALYKLALMMTAGRR